MAPWWPGTALLSTKAPRKLVFLFTLSLSVTYLFYSLISCYSSLQFPLQDAGIYLQPDSGVSPVDAIRTASVKPDTSNRDLITPEVGSSPHSSPRSSNSRAAPRRTSSGSSLDSYFQSRVGITTNTRNWDSAVQADPGARAKKSSGDTSVSGSPAAAQESGLPLSSPSSSRSSSDRQPESSTSFSRIRTLDSVPQPGFLLPTVRTSAPFHSATGDGVHSPGGSTSSIGLRPSSRDSAPAPSSSHRPSSRDSAPAPSSPQRPSTPDSAPAPSSSHRPSSRDSAPAPSSPQRPSTPDSAPINSITQKFSTLDSAPAAASSQRPSTLDSAPAAASPQRPSTLDSAPAAASPQRPSTLDSAPAAASPQRPSTPDSAPAAASPQRPSTPDSAPAAASPQRPSTLDSAPAPSSPQRPSTPDSAPAPSSPQRPSTPDSAPINSITQRFSTPDSAPINSITQRFSTPDSAPINYTTQRPSTLESAPAAASSQRPSTLDSAPINSITQRPSTPDSAPINSITQRFSTLDSAPINSITQRFSTLDSAPINYTTQRFSTLDSAPINYTTQRPSTLESAPAAASSQRPSTLDSAPAAASSQRPSTLDSAPINYTTPRPSTLDSAPAAASPQRPSTLDSAPAAASPQRPSTLDSAPAAASPQRPSTLDSAPAAASPQRPSTPDSAPAAASPQRPSTPDSAPAAASPQRPSTPDRAPHVRFSRNTNTHISSGNVNNESLYPNGPASSSNSDSTANSSVAPRWNDFSTDSVSLSLPVHEDNRGTDINRDPIKSYTGILASSSGEINRPSDFTGNEMLTPPQGVPTWDRTPLAATEMIPESHTGFLERDPQESSTTEEEFSHRISVNSTVEYGDKKLPQAIIIGVKKGGTRALLEALRAHPDVRAVGVEPHFFDRNYEKGLEWYRDLMPRTIEGQITMEKTPSYFVTNEAPQRIHSMAKDTKLIVVVRNPVTRAISDYTQTLSKKPEIPTFEVLAFKNRTLGLIDASWSALRIGIYALHLESWMQYFPLSQILFVSGERLISNPAEELAKVQEFLGLRRIITDKHFYFNKTKGFPCLKKPEDTGAPRCLGKSKGRTHPKIDPVVIQRLRKFYKPFNAMFYQMTGQDFQWEKEELES